jgi:hypothetical protein
MKVQLINSYKKLSNVTENGLPVLDKNGIQVKKLKTMFRYGLIGYTAAELALYKRFRSQDGTNYYREDKGTPLFHSTEFLGNSAVLNHYTREDGRVGFAVNTTEVDALQAMAEKYPHLAVTLGNQIAAMMLAGDTLKLEDVKVDEEEEVESSLDEL